MRDHFYGFFVNYKLASKNKIIAGFKFFIQAVFLHF